MFGLNRKKRRGGIPGTVAADFAPSAQALEATPPGAHAALLQRWMSLAATQQRVIKTLASEITRTSNYVEAEGEALSQNFQRLAVSAQQQTKRVDSLNNLAMGVEVEGRSVPIEEIVSLLEGTLADIVSKILLLSKDSMSMVYALDVLSANVENVGKCNGRIDGVNTTMTMLALNARIEAERAGPAGVAFRIVANEVRDLSKSTKALAANMNSELKAITDGINNSHATLKRVATVDMSANILIKERIELLLRGLVDRNDRLEGIVSDAVKEAEIISNDVGMMVTGLQFQDRTKQRLEHVVDTLQVIDQAIDEIKSSTAAILPELEATVPDTGWVKDLLSRYTMSDMRGRFVAHILDGEPLEWDEDTAAALGTGASGSMELF